MPDTLEQAPHSTLPAPVGRRRTILWIVNFKTPLAVPNGGTLRYMNYARALSSLGHRVYFLLPKGRHNDESLTQLKREGAIADYFLFAPYFATSHWNKFECVPLLSGFARQALQKAWAPVTRDVNEALARTEADTLIYSEKIHLFSVRGLKRRPTVLIDWCDSGALEGWRQLAKQWEEKNPRGWVEALAKMGRKSLRERHYGRWADANCVVSPVDRDALRRVSANPETAHVWLNGVALPALDPPVERIPERIIFTGTMSFLPNLQAAEWFIESVLPRILRERPGVKFVVAGASPPDSLRARASASVEVTGTVPDITHEIRKSQLYVAPLVSGGGFRNKVVEAMAAETFVIGTGEAVEFLDPELRACAIRADEPEAMARAVVQALGNPEEAARKAKQAREILARGYTWERRAQQMLAILDAAEAKREAAKPARPR